MGVGSAASPGRSRSLSQNSSVLHEDDDERSCSESETHLSPRPSAQQLAQVTCTAPPFLNGRLQVLVSYLPACLVHLLSFIHQTALEHSETAATLALDSFVQQCMGPVVFTGHCSCAEDGNSEGTAKVPALRALIFLRVGWLRTQKPVGENVCQTALWMSVTGEGERSVQARGGALLS